MGKIVYFDTNVFDHLVKRENNVTAADEKELRLAVQDGKISIPISLINLEEALCALENYPKEASKNYKIISDLSDCRKIIKTPRQMLLDDINAYARLGIGGSPYFKDSVLKINQGELRNPERIKELLRVITNIKEEKEIFRLDNIISKKDVLSTRNKLDSVPSFDQFWDSLKLDFARELAQESGMIEEYKYKNLNGLLEIRSIRLCVGWSLSYIYGQLFEGVKPKKGDSRDMKHSVLASAAEIFVTHDKELAGLLKRISLENFKVLGHLHELLNII